MNLFEWDENKRKSNLLKHSVDFVDMTDSFDDPNRLETDIIRNNESRYQTLGIINGILFFVVYTDRDNIKRIISARKASRLERKIYNETN